MAALVRELVLMMGGVVLGSMADLQLCVGQNRRFIHTQLAWFVHVTLRCLLFVHIIHYHDAYCVQNPVVFVRAAAFWKEVGL